MASLLKERTTPTLPESSIVLIGLVFTIIGLTFRDSVGGTSLLAALGIGLVIAGTVYIAVEGPKRLRLSLAFIALLALPLFSYGGVIQWVGGLMMAIVIAGAVYSRVST